MQKKVAFFDVDETLLNCKSMFSFLKFYIQNKYPSNSTSVFEEYTKKIQVKVTQRLPREELNIFFYSLWKDFNQKEVREIAKSWYQENKQKEGFFIEQNIEFLRSKRSEGYLIAAVSGSTYDILHAFIQEFEFDAYFFSEPEVKNGIYTGMLINNPMIGQYKAEAVTTFMEKENIDANNCIAVADHESDIPMLKCVGTAYLFKNHELVLLN